MVSLDVRHARWDRMRDALVVPMTGGELVVTHDALISIAGWQLAKEDAVAEAVEHGATLRAIAQSVPCVDGVATVTRAVADGRDWSVDPYDTATEDAYEVALGGRADR